MATEGTLILTDIGGYAGIEGDCLFLYREGREPRE